MSKTDEFDKILKNGFEKSHNAIPDEGFTEKVIARLPAKGNSLLSRNLILFLSCILSLFIFLISNGYRSLLLSVFNLFNSGLHSVEPSLSSFFIILIFISVSFVISRIEYNEDLV